MVGTSSIVYPNMLSVKLHIDTKSQKVLFAEAGKDFVDFLFNLLTLPLGTIIQVLNKDDVALGSVSTIYKSVEGLKRNYFFDNYAWETLSNPSKGVKKVYGCSNYPNGCRSYDGTSYMFCSCKLRSGGLLFKTYSITPAVSGGYVKNDVVYMVADDLAVEPLTSTSMVNLLCANGVKDVGTLKEKSVILDDEMGLKLLKASLQSESVLTSVFLSDSKV